MEAILNNIIEVEKKAKLIVGEALAQLEKKESDIAEKEKQYESNAAKTIAAKMEQLEADVEKEKRKTDAFVRTYGQKAADSLKENFSKNKKAWIEEMYNEVIKC